MQVAGADEMAAPAERRLHLLRPRAALAARADLEDILEMRHLGGSADRARIALAGAIHMIAPVEMGVVVDERDRPVLGESPEDRNGHAMIAADGDRNGAGRQDLADGSLCPAVVRLEIARFA